MNRLIRDLRQRRNLDVYVTIVVALVVSVLVLLEVVDQTRIVPLDTCGSRSDGVQQPRHP
jgi:hypothetical protein